MHKFVLNRNSNLVCTVSLCICVDTRVGKTSEVAIYNFLYFLIKSKANQSRIIILFIKIRLLYLFIK